jgi:pimeloyl-ACP methyl ester carboxylesterase
VTNCFDAPDGRRIAYADSGGDGPAVLCLPGLTRSMVDYADLAAHLAPRYRVIRTDYRGRGASGWAEEPRAEYTPIVEGQDAAALLAHLGVGKATIIGTSRGGIIGMLLAATQPDLVTALILNDIGPVVERAGLDFIMAYIGLDPGVPDFPGAAARLRAVYAADFPDLTDIEWLAFARRSFADREGRPVLNYDPKLRDATAMALDTSPPDLWPVFDALAGLAMLTIRGGNSNILSAETLAEMAGRRPDMAHVTLANRGHVPFLDEAQARLAIDAFLERHAT